MLLQVRVCCLALVSSASDLNPTLFGRQTRRTLDHSEIYARHVFFLSGCTPRPATEYYIERASRMASPSGVDYGPRTKHYGCRE
jgi:hypothetical protein